MKLKTRVKEAKEERRASKTKPEAGSNEIPQIA